MTDPAEVIREHLNGLCFYDGPNRSENCRATRAALSELTAEQDEAVRQLLEMEAERDRLREALGRIAAGEGFHEGPVRFAQAALSQPPQEECYCAARAGEGHKLSDHAGQK